jgi:hypothetical protein
MAFPFLLTGSDVFMDAVNRKLSMKLMVHFRRKLLNLLADRCRNQFHRKAVHLDHASRYGGCDDGTSYPCSQVSFF